MGLFNHSTSGIIAAQYLDQYIKGKTIVITGPTTGSIGGETAMSLSLHHPAQIVLIGRDEKKAGFVEDETKKLSPNTKITFVQSDFLDLDSVKRAASEVLSSVSQIDVLINNAGIMGVPHAQSRQGIESQFAVNHVAHFLLTNLLVPKMVPGSRIVNISSNGHELSGILFDDYNFSNGSTYHPWKAYGQSKTANVLFANQLAKVLQSKGINAYSLHPGLVTGTQLGSQGANFDQGMKLWADTHPGQESLGDPKNLQQGCSTGIVAAFAPELEGQSGAYLEDCEVKQPVEHARDPVAAEKLWKLSEELVGQSFSY